MGLKDKTEVTVVGSGTGIPSAYRASPSLLLRFGTHVCLLDMGPGALRQLSRLGIHPQRLDTIWITHFHPDHVADLVHFLFVTRSPAILPARRPFTIFGPKGLKIFIEGLQRVFGPCISLPGHIMSIHEVIPGEVIDCSGHRFQAIHTRHTPESLAYRISTPSKKSIVYTGDTGFSQDLVEFARDADLLVMEASFPESSKVKGHLTPTEAGQLAEAARVKHLLLTHFYPQCLATDIASACRSRFSGELTVAHDLLCLSL